MFRRTFLVNISIALILLPAFIFGQVKIYLGPTADSIQLYKDNNLVGQIVWKANAVDGPNDTIIASVGNVYEWPSSTMGKNVPLNYSIILRPQLLDSIHIKFYGSLKIRLFNNNLQYTFNDLTPADTSIKYQTVGIYMKNALTRDYILDRIWENDNSSYRGVTTRSIVGETRWVLAAPHVLKGPISRNSTIDSSTVPYFIHRKDSCTLGPGVAINADVVVFGQLTTSGQPGDSVCVKKVNLLKSSAENTFVLSRINKIATRNSKLIISNSAVDSMDIDSSKARINASYLGRFIDGSRSIIKIRDSYITASIAEPNQWSYSFLQFTKNKIHSAGPDNVMGGTGNSMMILDSNTFISSYPSRGGVGAVVGQGCFGLVRNNSFLNYTVALNTASDARTVVYNNTFSQSMESDICNTASTASLSIFNNIFYHSQYSYYRYLPIDLQDFLVNTATSCWLGNNMWYMQSGATNYIDIGDAKVYGDRKGINLDPKFADTIQYTLSASSPAIDSGVRAIKGFAFTFKVLDTSIAMPDSFYITGFQGTAPDIGAVEFGLINNVLLVENTIRKHSDRELSVRYVQNGFAIMLHNQNEQASEQRVTFLVVNAQGRCFLKETISSPGYTKTHQTHLKTGILPRGIYFVIAASRNRTFVNSCSVF